MKIAVVTATRAEYGILRPLMLKLYQDADVELQVLVTGTHLSEKYGNTRVEIEKDGLPVFRKIPILAEGNSAFAVSQTMANAIVGFAEYFEEEKPACVVVLGDRTEMLGVCAAAMDSGVPIAHLHGGELTEGAVDDCVRHAITKMSYLHFPSTEVYRRRIIQMGETPNRVFNVGALGVENILHVPLLSEDEIRAELDIPEGKDIVSVTFHPVTMEAGDELRQVEELIAAMKMRPQYFYLITKANADAGGDIVNDSLEKFASASHSVRFVASLGMRKYLSVVKHSMFVLGNSSSGITEAPSLGTPTVNIGDRQKGRLMADSVICCEPKRDSIVETMDKAASMKHVPSFIYGDGNTSDKIIGKIKDFFGYGPVIPRKTFYDIEADYE